MILMILMIPTILIDLMLIHPMLIHLMLIEPILAGSAITISDILVLISAITLAIGQLITLIKAKSTVILGEKTLAEINNVAAEARVISRHVNGNATSQVKTIDGLVVENRLLRGMLANTVRVETDLSKQSISKQSIELANKEKGAEE